MNKKLPLHEIWKTGLCIGCGACVSICPKNLIELRFSKKQGLYFANIPSDNKKSCIRCDLCFKVCPAARSNKEKNNAKLKIGAPLNSLTLINWLIGHYRKIYTGYAANRDLRYNCSSGGIITALIKYMIKSKYINGALVARPISNKSIRHNICLIKEAEDVFNHKGTIYCQIDYSTAWSFIQNTKDTDRLAIIGQPCYLKAVDLFMAAKKLPASRILKIGFFCGGISNHNALEYLCNRKKINTDNVLNIQYRTGGWPGRKITATVNAPNTQGKKSKVTLLNRDESWRQKNLYNFCFSGPFFAKQCLKCVDQTSEHADITIGDAWLPRFTLKDSIGTNIIISRTTKGEKVIQDALSNNAIELQDAQPEDVLQSQGNCLVGRKLGLWGKHIKNGYKDIPEAIYCKQYIPQYVPKRKLLIERRLFHWLSTTLPSHPAFLIFSAYMLIMHAYIKFIYGLKYLNKSITNEKNKYFNNRAMS